MHRDIVYSFSYMIQWSSVEEGVCYGFKFLYLL